MKPCDRYWNANACADIATLVLQSTLDAERVLENPFAVDGANVQVFLVSGKPSALRMLLQLQMHAGLLNSVRNHSTARGTGHISAAISALYDACEVLKAAVNGDDLGLPIYCEHVRGEALAHCAYLEAGGIAQPGDRDLEALRARIVERFAEVRS